MSLGFRVTGFRVESLEYRVEGMLGFRVWAFEFRV